MNHIACRHNFAVANHLLSQSSSSVLLDERMDWTLSDQQGRCRAMPIHYRLHGRPKGPLLVALGGISANRQVQCWWRSLYGAGRVFDPERYRILSIDWLVDEAGITTADQADALAEVVEHLDLGSIDRLIGASYGAMVGLAFAERHGQRLRRLIAISGAHRSRPSSTALRQIQRDIVALGRESGQPARGVAVARTLALTTYRPAALFDRRFAAETPAQIRQSLSDYLGHQGKTFSSTHDATRYLCLSTSLDDHCIDPTRIRCPVDLIGVDSDHLVPPEQLDELARAIGPDCRVHILNSCYGHDAFLKEPDAITALLRDINDQERLS